ncbi:MAG: hypothetical protein HYY20_06690 [Candidatus Tectomicrobia bacterium]|uniref:Uncharacterized protein n=1 Tax=Tectimicrobiota bacterium TaxID=2528274 RepID=A0A932CNB5_UNCTE|nr:hypothetical protein [Candidatus Tectomicrobia bacterium]
MSASLGMRSEGIEKGVAMLGLGKHKQVTEYEAEGEIDRVYYEIKQTLRVTGINLNFRVWAGYKNFLPAMWEAVRPNVETRIFEDAADRVRAEAVSAAEALGKLDAASKVHLGESQIYQIKSALDLYHYINPKLLVLTSAVRLALVGEQIGQESKPGMGIELIERGVPLMYPMEMVSEEVEDKRTHDLFEDIKRTLSLSSINSDYRTLALWPNYLAAAWERLKPTIQGDEYVHASDRLREISRTRARALPYPILLSSERVEELGEDPHKVMKTIEEFERLLPSLILNIALFELDWRSPEVLVRSPFPAAPRRSPGSESGGAQ